MTKLVPRDWRAILICLFVCIGACQFGYDSSYFSGILVMEPFLKLYGHYDSKTETYVVSSTTQSVVTSIINTGEFLGAVTSYWIGDRIGRKGGLLLSSVIVIIGTTLQIASTYIGLLIAGRLVLGYAVGLISCFVPLYAADCAPARFRGAIVSMYQFVLGVGLLLGVCVDYATANRTDSGSFRIPIAIQYIFPLVLFPGLLILCPESPRWLASRNRLAECEASLRKLNGRHVDVSDQVAELAHSLRRDASEGKGSWSSVFKWGPEGRKAYLGFALQAFQQASGVNFITGYGVYFFSSVGIDNAFLISIGLYLCGWPATFFSQYGIEKWGRRPMLLVSGSCMAASSIIMGSLGLNASPSLQSSQAIVGMVFFFLITFNIAWGPTVWVVTSELSTGPNRGRLMSLSTGSNWLFTWLVSFTFPYLYNDDAAGLGPKIGFIYGIVMLCAVVWVFFLLPETAQRSLEEIDEMFARGVPARSFISYTARHEPELDKGGEIGHVENLDHEEKV